MRFKKYIAILGAILVIAGAMSPMLRIPVIGNWNYWDLDVVLASVIFVLAAVGLLGAILKQPGLVKFSGWAVIVVVIFTLIAVYFKVNNYFSFIPFKKLARVATGMVRYQWTGWALLFSGALFMVFSSRKGSP